MNEHNLMPKWLKLMEACSLDLSSSLLCMVNVRDDRFNFELLLLADQYFYVYQDDDDDEGSGYSLYFVEK